MKKYLLILPILIIIIFGFLAFWQKSDPPTNVGTNTGLPFGEGGNNTFTQNFKNTEGEIRLVNPSSNPSRLFKLPSPPVAGFIPLQNGTSTIVRYADRATGHIFDVSLSNLVKTRIHNNTIPKVYRAVFRSDGNAVIYQTLSPDLETIENLSINLSSTSSPATVLRGKIGS